MAVHALMQPAADFVVLALMNRQTAEAAIGELLFAALQAYFPEHTAGVCLEGFHRLELVTPGTSGHDQSFEGLRLPAGHFILALNSVA